MAEVHLFQWVAAFFVASGVTASWLLVRPASRWRHIVTGLISTVLWIPVAYTAGNVGVADGGEVVAFGSDALGSVGIFMVVVSIAATILGLVLWVEEATQEAHDSLPNHMQHQPGDRRG